jgi:hypothetical protein
MQTALGALPAPLLPPDDPLLAGIERTANVRLV